jgi:signal transduction histidine kinase
VLYAVSDTGIGIPTHQMEHIFEEFRQADVTVSRDFGGTGLGLSITRKLVELHGGRIWVESAVGKGSIFFFSIPARVAPKAAA